MSTDIIFLKLGGSLLTDKTGFEALRPEIMARLAEEIAVARRANPSLKLVLGHGSGSFGHVAGAKYGTRSGVYGPEQWFGFAEVADAAARLNRIVVASLLSAGVPAVGLSSFASARVSNGKITHLNVETLRSALNAGLVPVVYGDVAFDAIRGGTIISTEEIMEYLSAEMPAAWLLLAGETPGVLDLQGEVIPLITRHTLPEVLPALGASRGTDVTGGMASKVLAMLDLVEARPNLSVRIFSGLEPGLLQALLMDPSLGSGTLLRYV